MNVVLSLETWDIDDTLALLFLAHYHQKGKIDLLAVEVDKGPPSQNNYVKYLLQKIHLNVPVFSRNVEEDKSELPEYYYELFEDLKLESQESQRREELLDLLKGKEFKLVVGGSLNLIPFLLENSVFPEEIFVQGGFAGKNITGKTHEKFGDRYFKATFNFNKDVKATLRTFELLKEFRIPTYLISKNLNHTILIKEEDIPQKEPSTKAQELYFEILKKYLRKYRKEKSLHDVYACIAMFKKNLFVWKEVIPVYRKGRKYTEWGSVEAKSNIWITVDGKREEIKDYAVFRKEF
ncbi:nucleoside hydrolase [Aquifex aeolicus]|uniref:Uncharacterized protein aq_983 n=1 Tax=Aquifex aeolicus (strain VF5) TaxID=224324 RepID=Y983_AQUAE|nr:nucleoside hydrolase [Aquifex aeolicus]O67109.1 RecName: Full=Uncharacterized protein aq_983 [Aquifex aeolicus VF5]AAC07075.1 putative protein [Aquifex aeolicus VF5]